MALTALAFNCTLKSSGELSSTDRLLREIMDEFKTLGVSGEIIRALDHDIKPGVTSNEGDGDAWPALRERVLSADILIIGLPIWMGQPSSVAKRILERMDAFFSEKDDKQRMPSYGKVGLCAVVGNEDGAHHVAAEVFQALNDVGFTIPSNGMTYWVGEAMEGTNYIDLKKTPKNTAEATRLMAVNAVHLATLLSGKNYPGMRSQ